MKRVYLKPRFISVWTEPEIPNPKSEAPKSEGNPKSEIRNPKSPSGPSLSAVAARHGSACGLSIKCRAHARRLCDLGPRISNFGLRISFGFRPSDFGFHLLLALAVALAVPALGAPANRGAAVILVVGAAGEDDFGANFARQADLWQRACAQGQCRCITLGLAPSPRSSDYDRLKETLAAQPKEGLEALWLVLIGHGTFDGKEAKFNLRGPDVSAAELAVWLRPFRRPLAVIDTASCSAPFLNLLSATNRVIITATRSGHEQNYARFGQYLAESLTDPAADLDKDGQVSLLEAFLTASHHAAEFYKLQGRLLTEHALLDDNGDGLGTPADWFRGLRAVKKPKDNAGLDGLVAQRFCLVPSESERKLTPEQRARRDTLERAVLLHREKKGQMNEQDYYRQLEQLLLPLARFYQDKE